MYAWIAVAVGGAIGSVARHAVNRVVHQEWPFLRFPLATVIVNVGGCCVIGVLAGLVATGRLPMRTNWREFVFVGILGGFTTFSTFGLDTVTLIRAGDNAQAIANVAVQVMFGLGGVYGGLLLVERIGGVAR
jgi:fluoride exporter